MPADATPGTEEDLVTTVGQEIEAAAAARQIAIAMILALDVKQAAMGHHPHYAAYIHGGMFGERDFGARHILSLLGFHALDFRDALARLKAADTDDEDRQDMFAKLRCACGADPMLEIAGERLLGDLGLLKGGRVDPFMLRRPKFGLGQVALVFGLGPEHASAHRGLYDLDASALRRLFEDAGVNQRDQRLGALLVPAMVAGGESLAAVGAAAFHRDAEARYRDDCQRFAEHQRVHPSRRWRWKPARSTQGHLAVTTARMKGIAAPAERTRGHSANWLDDHDANLRFNRSDEA